MAATTQLVTVEEFSGMPEDKGPVYHELRHGKIVAIPFPNFGHACLRRRLRQSLIPITGAAGFFERIAFRALPEYELRVADVAWATKDHLDATDPDDYLRGAPELVIELVTPSLTLFELYDKEQLCLENGAKEFWEVDPERRLVKISTPDGHTVTWRSGQQIPLPMFGNAAIAVDSIFE
jgi:Uma2 family endonuclease